MFEFVSHWGIFFSFFPRVLMVVSTSLFFFLFWWEGAIVVFASQLHVAFFLHGCLVPCQGQFAHMFSKLVISFPPPMCRLRPLFPLFLPFPVQLFMLVFKLGPVFPLVARVGPNVMSHVSDVVPFFQDVVCLDISNIVRLFRLFLKVIIFVLQLPFLPILPLNDLDLGVRSGPPSRLPFRSSLAIEGRFYQNIMVIKFLLESDFPYQNSLPNLPY